MFAFFGIYIGRRMTFLATPQNGLKEREPRRQVFLKAQMGTGGRPADICVRNISSRGMLLQAASPPPRGTYVEIFLPRHTIVARVIWSKDRKFGVQTREPMNVDAIAGMNTGWTTPKLPDAVRPAVPRRNPLTAAEIAARVERSRRISAAMEFGVILLCSLTAAVIAGSLLYEQLASTFANVAPHL